LSWRPNDRLVDSATATSAVNISYWLLLRPRVQLVRPSAAWVSHRRSCDPGSGHIPFTPRTKKCLELSLREALALRHRHIGVEHITLALTAMTDGLVPRILPVIGASAAQVRTEILHRFREAG